MILVIYPAFADIRVSNLGFRVFRLHALPSSIGQRRRHLRLEYEQT
jgi:hypothetical protein